MTEKRRTATLVAFAYTFEKKSLDDALDLLDLLITDITAQAKKIGQKQGMVSLNKDSVSKDLTTGGVTAIPSIPSMIISSIVMENNQGGAYLDQQYSMSTAAKLYFWNTVIGYGE